MRRKGFTLVELLVVIIIVGILAAVAVPSMTGNVKKAKRSEAVAALGSLRTAQRLYYVEKSSYATNLESLNSYITESDLDGAYYKKGNYTVNDESGMAEHGDYGTVTIKWTNGEINGG